MSPGTISAQRSTAPEMGELAEEETSNISVAHHERCPVLCAPA
jgi:hypothetical protein